MPSKQKFPAIIRPSKADPVALLKTIQSLTEAVEILVGARGASNPNRAVTLDTINSAIESGVAETIASIAQGTGDGVTLDPVGTPQQLEVLGSVSYALLTWNAPIYRGHAYTEIYRSTTDDFGTSVRVATTLANVYGDPVDAGSTYYYWIRFVRTDDEIGPINATAGTSVTTGLIPDEQLGSIAADKIVAFTSAFVLSTIGEGNITDAYIGNTIQSAGYSTAGPGWQIDKNVGLTIRGTNGDIVLQSLINGANVMDYSAVVNGPPANATNNTIFRQGAEPTTGTTGDLWFNTTTEVLYEYFAGAWGQIGNYADNTNQLTDGAGLGNTALWNSVTGAGKPADNADVTASNPQHPNWLSQPVVGQHNPITGTNYSTYLQSAAIQNLMANVAWINSANIVDAAVSTLKIQGNAVSLGVGVHHTSEALIVSYPAYNTWYTLTSRTIDVSGAGAGSAVIAWVDTAVRIQNGGGDDTNHAFELRFLRTNETTVLYTATGAGPGAHSFRLPMIDNIGALSGTKTYALQIRFTGGTPWRVYRGVSGVVLNLGKR